ncbi:MAG TPA: hypothetical protein VJ476_01275 [Rhizomicrobium sp.]|nr:hypothetical protein [Rhizomicrobium sp.]
MRKALILIAIAVLAATLFFAIAAEKATLIVIGDTPVVDRVTNQAQVVTIDHLKTGDHRAVYRCIDTKSYFVYEIRLDDSRIGYVVDGKYRLDVKSAWRGPWTNPIVFNCY